MKLNQFNALFAQSERYPETSSILLNFRVKATLGIVLVAVILIAPFIVNHALSGRLLLTLVIMLLEGVLVYIAWNSYKGILMPRFVFWVYVPVLMGVLVILYQNQHFIASLWSFPALIGLYIMLPERRALIASQVVWMLCGVLAWLYIEPAIAVRVIMTLFVVNLFTAVIMRVLKIQHIELQRLASTDTLTGVSNRSQFHVTLETIIQQHSRSSVPMSLVLFDLDWFKRINDDYGHLAGDDVLSTIGHLLQEKCRATDHSFRLGGEEFIVTLYNANQQQAMIVAEGLRKSISELEFTSDLKITASFGVTELQTDDNVTSWMKRADQALYKAKNNGRNRVEFA